jgi:hypothetical protein
MLLIIRFDHNILRSCRALGSMKPIRVKINCRVGLPGWIPCLLSARYLVEQIKKSSSLSGEEERPPLSHCHLSPKILTCSSRILLSLTQTCRALQSVHHVHSPIRNVEEQDFSHTLSSEGKGGDRVCSYRGKERNLAQRFSCLYIVPEKENEGHNPGLFPGWRKELIYYFHTVFWNEGMHKVCNRSPPVSVQQSGDRRRKAYTARLLNPMLLSFDWLPSSSPQLPKRYCG